MRFEQRLAVLALTVGLPAWAGGADIVDRVVAVVGRHPITLSEAERALELGMVRGGKDLSLPEIVERLIESYLIEREVQRYPAEPVPKDEVRRAVDSLRDTFTSEEDFNLALRNHGMDVESLERILKRQLGVHRYLDRRFRALVYVSEEEIQRYYEEEIVPTLSASGESVPRLEVVSERIRQIIVEKKFNERVDQWIESLKSRARIRRYVW